MVGMEPMPGPVKGFTEYKKQLQNYYAILSGSKNAKYMESDLVSLERDSWKLLNPCRLCEFRCGASRPTELGYCRSNFNISSEFLHMGEESFLVPSHTIFFIGCNFRCVYCQNWEISQGFDPGYYLEPKKLAAIIADKSRISRNVNWVGGEPTPNIPYVVKVLEELKKLHVNKPQIWNTNAYMTPEALNILNEIIDLWLPDFKYGNNECGQRLSSVPRYWETITRNIKAMEGDLLIRHLVLPNHFECCTKPILDWIAKELEGRAIVNIMAQYRPVYRAMDYPDISRPVTYKEWKMAMDYANQLGIPCYH